MRSIGLTDLRRVAKRTANRISLRLPRLRTSDQFLFDHIPRTGGTYFASVLNELVGTTSENFDTGPDYPESHKEDIRQLDRYDVVVGHMRLDVLKAFHRRRPRHIISLVRDPADLIESTYKFWRNNVTLDLHHCNLAKQLNFCDFIRHTDVRMTVDNPLTRHFYNLWDFDRLEATESSKTMAIRMVDSYAFIGVTERMEETVLAFTKTFPIRKRHLDFTKINRNESKGQLTTSAEDLHYLREVNQLDYAVYQHVNQCLDRTLYGTTTPNRCPQEEFARRVSLK